MPVACRIARASVRYRVYWVILVCPAWPSFLRVSSRGITTTSSCRMMLVVMYGMIPSAKIATPSRAPPENSLISPYRPSFLVWSKQACTLATLTPGVGICAPSRKITTTSRTNSSFFRRSGVRNALANAPSTVLTPSSFSSRTRVPAESGPNLESLTGARTAVGCCRSHSSVSFEPLSGGRGARRGRRPPSDLGRASAGGGDLLLGRGGERVRAHLHGHRDVSRPEHLDRRAVADGALGDQVLDADGPALGEERADAVEVDHLELDLERVLEALQLRQPHVQRHLAALEGRRDLVAGLGALGASTCRLPLRSLTATHTGLRGPGAGGRTQVVPLERHVSPPPRRRSGA